MHLKDLTLINFKNHGELRLEFSPELNIFTGNNGTGKTNLLDAIYYLCFCRSFLNPVDSQIVNHDEKFFMIQGVFQKGDRESEVQCAFRTGQKKRFSRDKKVYERLAEHIGEFPSVVISPYDTDLITEGSDTRRKFLDSIISQFDRAFLEKLIRYNKILEQRNALLKQFREMRIFEAESIDVWDQQLVEPCEYIFEKRRQFTSEFIPIFQRCYDAISGGKEKIDITYESHLFDGDFAKQLLDSRNRDTAAGFTTTGIHKDDLIFVINDQPVKKFGSQGQQKSFLIGLRLAQFEIIAAKLKITPVLLLDDIFDKLDQERVEQIMKLLSDGSFGQVFITDTDADRIEKVFHEIPTERKIFNLNQLANVQATQH